MATKALNQNQCLVLHAQYGAHDCCLCKERREVDALRAQVAALELDRDERGPYFVRDMARLVGLPDDATMDDVFTATRFAISMSKQKVAALEEAGDGLADVAGGFAGIRTNFLNAALARWREAREAR